LRRFSVGGVLVDHQEGTDMRRFAQLAGERLVGLVLPRVEAGACVPEHGQCCKKGYRFNCTGLCTSKSSTCK
jgi:hypothetical protein